MRRASEMEHVGRIVQVGLRGVGSARASDVEDARAAGNLLVTARELRERGVAWCSSSSRRTHRSSSPSTPTGWIRRVCPAVSAPAPGGLSWDEAVGPPRRHRPRLVGAAFTEVVPRSTSTICRPLSWLASCCVQRATSTAGSGRGGSRSVRVGSAGERIVQRSVIHQAIAGQSPGPILEGQQHSTTR